MSYFQLAQQLLTQYFAPAPVEVVFSGERHLQWTAGGYTVVVTETSATSTLINVLAENSAVAVPINWQEWDIAEIKPSEELQRRFDLFLNLKLHPATAPESGGNRKEERHQPQVSTDPGVFDQTGTRLPRVYPLETEARRPADMPDFDDEYEISGRNRTAAASGVSVGERDLYPAGVGRYPEMKPYLDPLAAGRGGGMFVGPDDPMFGQRGGNTSRRGVPPGARFDDPYGEDSLQDMGMGLPGNLRGPGGPGGFGGAGSGGAGFGFGGAGSGGAGFGSGGAGYF